MKTPKSRRRDSRYRFLAALAVGLLLCSCKGAGSKPDAGDGGESITPRQIAPLSTVMVRDLRPAFRWIGEDGDTFRLELSSTLDFSDILYSWSGTAFEHFPSSDLPAGPVYWRVCLADDPATCSPTWMFFAGRVPHDVNGDGYSDLFVGGIGAGCNGYIFFGGPSVEPALAIEDADVFLENGGSEACSTYGDITGDGISDVVIGDFDFYPCGKVFICPGSQQWNTNVDVFDSCPGIGHDGATNNIGFGNKPSTRHDIDLDGIHDLVASHTSDSGLANYGGSVFLFLSSQGSIASRSHTENADVVLRGTSEWQGLSGKTLSPDINGDGHPDLLLTGPSQPSYGIPWIGEAYVLLGETEFPEEIASDDLSLTMTTTDEETGFWAGDAASDVNGDGYGDFLLGYKAGPADYWIMVVSGGASLSEEAGPDSDLILTRIKHPGGIDDYGHNIGMFGAGDLNGDGLDDTVITLFGANSNPNFQNDPLGAVYVFYGRKDFPPVMEADDADVKVVGNGDPWFAYSWVSVGDFNGDGNPDFAMAATGDGPGNAYDEFPGRVFVFFGGPTLAEKQTADDADVIISSINPNEMFGICMNQGRGF